MVPHASIPDPLVDPLRDADYLVKQISSITQRDRADVARQLQQEDRDLGSSVREALAIHGAEPHVWSESLLAFYDTTDAFLFETTIWNRRPPKLEMRLWIASYLQRSFPDAARILTYGDGLGFDSLFLRQAGHEVHYFDVSRYGATFAARLGRDFGPAFEIIETEADIEQERFDVVVCLDVLEHVPEPPQTVRRLAKALRPGGRLIVHAPFWYISRKAVTHLRKNRRHAGDWRRLYGESGLSPVDCRWFWMPLVLQKDASSVSPIRRAKWRIRLSQWLLSFARLWSAPHLWITRFRLRCSDPWRELEALAEASE